MGFTGSRFPYREGRRDSTQAKPCVLRRLFGAEFDSSLSLGLRMTQIFGSLAQDGSRDGSGMRASASKKGGHSRARPFFILNIAVSTRLRMARRRA